MYKVQKSSWCGKAKASVFYDSTEMAGNGWMEMAGD